MGTIGRNGTVELVKEVREGRLKGKSQVKIRGDKSGGKGERETERMVNLAPPLYVWNMCVCVLRGKLVGVWLVGVVAMTVRGGGGGVFQVALRLRHLNHTTNHDLSFVIRASVVLAEQSSITGGNHARRSALLPDTNLPPVESIKKRQSLF